MGIRSTLPPALPLPALTGAVAAARRLADRLHTIIRPLRVLDAVRWPDAVERAFHAAGGSELPAITAADYRTRPLPFSPADVACALRNLKRDVLNELGRDHPAGRILIQGIRDAGLTARLIAARGTPEFPKLSRELFGSTFGAIWQEELGKLLGRLLVDLPDDSGTPRPLFAHEAATDLQHRFTRHFGPAIAIRVVVCDSLAADAAAGNGYLKLRSAARFHVRDLRLLEVHEGWAHLATTLNGLRQPVLPMLARCLPSATATQEGLAVFLELAEGAAGRDRIRKLGLRVEAVGRAEAGADFREVYRYLLEATGDPITSYRQAARVFRGSLPTGGAFTKDLSYGAGLIAVLRQARTELTAGGWGRLPLLFCGKTAIANLDDLAELGRLGWLAPPRWLPPAFRNRAALTDRLAALAETMPLPK